MDRVALQGMGAEDIIGLFKQAIIRRQFPAQFLLDAVDEANAWQRAVQLGPLSMDSTSMRRGLSGLDVRARP
jgi:hypothetical protein